MEKEFYEYYYHRFHCKTQSSIATNRYNRVDFEHGHTFLDSCCHCVVDGSCWVAFLSDTLTFSNEESSLKSIEYAF